MPWVYFSAALRASSWSRKYLALPLQSTCHTSSRMILPMQKALACRQTCSQQCFRGQQLSSGIRTQPSESTSACHRNPHQHSRSTQMPSRAALVHFSCMPRRLRRPYKPLQRPCIGVSIQPSDIQHAQDALTLGFRRMSADAWMQTQIRLTDVVRQRKTARDMIQASNQQGEAEINLRQRNLELDFLRRCSISFQISSWLLLNRLLCASCAKTACMMREGHRVHPTRHIHLH